MWVLNMGAGFLFYLLPYGPVPFYGSLGLAIGLSSYVLYRHEKQAVEPKQNVSKSQREKALEWFIREVKRE
jgi:hypothetical protein